MNLLKFKYCFALFLLFTAQSIAGLQASDTLVVGTIDSIIVTAARLPTEYYKSPYTISHIDQRELQGGRQELSLAAPLSSLPGLVVLNSNNFAQDLRLSIRGFGARSAFGIRGLKILVDGMPETTPDGQGQVDNIDAGIIADARLFSGPSSGMYGNAAGGIIQLNSEEPPEKMRLESRLILGSYRFQRSHLKAGNSFNSYRWIASGSHFKLKGYREHSGTESTIFNTKIQRHFSYASKLELLINYLDSPAADDPGGLSMQPYKDDPSKAWGRNITFNAGEKVRQGKIGLRLHHERLNGSILDIYGFYLFRDFKNRLPFESGGSVNLFRHFTGTGIKLLTNPKLFGLNFKNVFGVDLEWQTDKRKRYDNLEGKLGELVFDQMQMFGAAGIYWIQEWPLLKYAWLNSALRYDFNIISADDHLQNNEDQTGFLEYHNLSPSIGISFRYSKNQFVYGSYSRSFETPALSELSANPNGDGFNSRLKPQYAHNFESGIKGRLSPQVWYQVTAFYLTLKNELVPYELSSSPGRIYYRNAGSSIRKGLESLILLESNNWLWGRLSFTFSDFQYTDYKIHDSQFKGKRLPGIPKYMASGQTGIDYFGKYRFTLEARSMGRIYADDGNTAFSDSFLELNLRFSRQFTCNEYQWKFFGGINNLLDSEYVNNIRINAFGGRYFEPSPGINVYAGIQVLFSNND